MVIQIRMLFLLSYGRYAAVYKTFKNLENETKILQKRHSLSHQRWYREGNERNILLIDSQISLALMNSSHIFNLPFLLGMDMIERGILPIQRPIMYLVRKPLNRLLQKMPFL